MKKWFLVGFLLPLVFQAGTTRAAENAEYWCRWYFIRECGTGHSGGMEFLEEDGNGTIWTTAANYASSALWQFNGHEWSQRYKVGRPGSSFRAATWDAEEEGMFFATDQGLLRLSGDVWEMNTQMFIVAGFGPSLFHYVHRPDGLGLNAVPSRLTYTDKRGDVWVYAPNIGLFRRTGPHPAIGSQGRIWNEHTSYWPREGGGVKLIDLIDKEEPSVLHAVDEETLLIGTKAGSLFVLHEKRSRHAQATDVELKQKHTANKIGIPEEARISAITTDSDGSIWMAYAAGKDQGGVARLKDQTWTIYNHANSRLPARPVTAIARLTGDRIWAGVDWNDPTVGAAPAGTSYEKTGLLEFSRGEWEFVETEAFRANARVLDAGPGEAEKTALYNECYRWINFIKPGRRGDVWVGTQGGLAQFIPTINE